MLELKNVVSGYGSTMVLRGVNFSLEPGKPQVILGRNGVGKTTLLKTIIGELKLREGTIHLDTRDLSHTPPHERARAGLAYVPQGREIFPALTVFENLVVATHRGRRAERRDCAMEMIEMFPALKPKASDLGRTLSGGQQQILALARALITQPKYLLLDEPSEGIQPSIVAEIAEKIRQVAERDQIAVLVAEQNLDFVTRVSDEVNLFDHGNFVRTVTTAELLSNLELQHEFLGV